jgi:hypothetical protein
MLQRLVNTRGLFWRSPVLLSRAAFSISTLRAASSKPNSLSFATPLLEQHLRNMPADSVACKAVFTPVFDAVVAANYERVVGVHPSRIAQHFNDTGGFLGHQFDLCSINHKDILEGWSEIITGKDLFRNGVGKFDIPAIINEIHARRQRSTSQRAPHVWLAGLHDPKMTLDGVFFRSELLDVLSRGASFVMIRAKSLLRIVNRNGGSKCKTKADAIKSLWHCFKTVACSRTAICYRCRQLSVLSVMCRLEEKDPIKPLL